MKRLHAILDGFEKIMCVLLGALMILLVCDIILQVIARYCFSTPPVWTEELARRLMLLVVYCGSAIAYRKCEMTGITLLVENFPRGIQKICQALMDGAIAVFCLFLAWYGCQMCANVGGQLSPALHMPKWPFYAVIPFFGVMTAVFAVEKILRAVAETAQDGPKGLERGDGAA